MSIGLVADKALYPLRKVLLNTFEYGESTFDGGRSQVLTVATLSLQRNKPTYRHEMPQSVAAKYHLNLGCQVACIAKRSSVEQFFNLQALRVSVVFNMDFCPQISAKRFFRTSVHQTLLSHLTGQYELRSVLHQHIWLRSLCWVQLCVFKWLQSTLPNPSLEGDLFRLNLQGGGLFWITHWFWRFMLKMMYLNVSCVNIRKYILFIIMPRSFKCCVPTVSLVHCSWRTKHEFWAS